MGVLPVLFHRHMEHGGGAGTVDVAVLRKDLQPPGLAGQKRKDTGFNGGEVGNDEFVSVPRHKCRADEFRQDFRHGVIQCREQGVIAGTDKTSCILQMRHVILREVLQLDQPARPAAAAVGTIKLEHPSRPAVCTDGVLHCLVLLYRGLSKLPAQFQHLGKFRRRGFQQFLHGFLVQGVHLKAMLCKPFLHLLDGVRVFQGGELPHLCREFFPGTIINGDGLFYQRHVKLYAPVVDFLVEMVFLP